MSRVKSTRFKVLKKIADRFENLAAQDLGKSMENLSAQRSRLVELQKFREEYTQQFHTSGSEGITSTAMQAFQQFIRQIDTAISQQTKTIVTAEHDQVEKKDNWEGKHRTTRIYDKTIERFNNAERCQQELREQNETDERNNVIRPVKDN